MSTDSQTPAPTVARTYNADVHADIRAAVCDIVAAEIAKRSSVRPTAPQIAEAADAWRNLEEILVGRAPTTATRGAPELTAAIEVELTAKTAGPLSGEERGALAELRAAISGLRPLAPVARDPIRFKSPALRKAWGAFCRACGEVDPGEALEGYVAVPEGSLLNCGGCVHSSRSALCATSVCVASGRVDKRGVIFKPWPLPR